MSTARTTSRAKPKDYGPKPRTIPKRAVKVCPAGHRQTARWRPGDACLRCERDRLEAIRSYDAATERRRWEAELGPPPAVMTIRTGDGKTITHRIPKGMARRARRS
jgi:hypothetical protein